MCLSCPWRGRILWDELGWVPWGLTLVLGTALIGGCFTTKVSALNKCFPHVSHDKTLSRLPLPQIGWSIRISTMGYVNLLKCSVQHQPLYLLYQATSPPFSGSHEDLLLSPVSMCQIVPSKLDKPQLEGTLRSCRKIPTAWCLCRFSEG